MSGRVGTMSMPRVSRAAITLPILAGIVACGLVALQPVEAYAQTSDEGALELVDPNVFRACGDPRNLPFSNDKGEGFENKLAELFAAKLGKKLSYTYFPQATGFVRKTLGAFRLRYHHGISPGRRSGAGDSSLLSDDLCPGLQARQRPRGCHHASTIQS